MDDNRPRFDAPPDESKKLLEAFLVVSTHGDMQGLLAILSNDVTLYSDGGGEANAAINPTAGRDHVARFLIGSIKKLVPEGVTTKLNQANGHPM